MTGRRRVPGSGSRRSVLKLLGVGGLVLGAGSVAGRPFRTSQDGADGNLPVETHEPTFRTSSDRSQVTFRGEVSDFQGRESVDRYFEWREIGDGEWNETASVTMSQPIEFQHGVTIEEGTPYEYRAIVEGDGIRSAGNLVLFECNGGDSGGAKRHVTFTSCSRATVTGTFETDDVAFASTGFYTIGGFGNTIIEDGVRFGDDVDAPFTGTVVFKIGEESIIEEGADEITVEIPPYGDDGTVISGLTTREDDYITASFTHPNPYAEACLEEIENGDEPEPATFEVAALRTNSPVGGGGLLEVEATIHNVGDETGTTDVELVVGHTPTVEDSELLTLESGESATVSLSFRAGQPAGDVEAFPVEIDTGADTAVETVRVESDGDDPTPATFNVMDVTTNSPVSGGETLRVNTTIQNVGDETGTTDVELVVGHAPTTEDSELLTLEPGESATFSLSFQAGQPSGEQEEFPVVIDTGADTGSETVLVES